MSDLSATEKMYSCGDLHAKKCTEIDQFVLAFCPVFVELHDDVVNQFLIVVYRKDVAEVGFTTILGFPAVRHVRLEGI
jgi:hypothetical protein